MKKLILMLLATGVMSLGFSTFSMAQEEGDSTQTEAVAEPTPVQQEVTDLGEDLERLGPGL